MKRGRRRNHIYSTQGLGKLGPIIHIGDEKRRERLPHETPKTPTHSKLAPSTISKESKEMKLSENNTTLEFEGKYLKDRVSVYEGKAERLKYEINDLWPQFEQEIEVENRKRHDSKWAKYGTAEIKIWKRFCYSYTRFYQNVAKACDYSGISRGHYYRARNMYPSLNLILEIIEDRLIDEIEETTKKHALLPNSIVERIFLLKTRRKDKYADTPTVLAASKIDINFEGINDMRESNVKVGVKGNDKLQTSSNTIEVPQVKE